ncbi:MAG: RNA pyrophosphohydrolase [Pseudomonadota bacterium]
MADWREGKPYRPNVGICLINSSKRVWFGKTPSDGPEKVTEKRCWQMPQGGIELSEDLVEAARRELWEETGVTSVEVLQVTTDWWCYDFPIDHTPANHKLDAFCGQQQRWVAFRFTGEDTEIEISAEHTDEPREFLDWKWLNPKQAIELAVDFKVEQYRKVFASFSAFLA